MSCHRDHDRHRRLGLRLGEQNLALRLGHQLRRLGEQNRHLEHRLGEQNRPDGLGHRHLQDDQRQEHPDDLGHRHHLGGLDRRLGVGRLGDPFPEKEQTGYFPDARLDEECPCPAPKRMGCCQGEECRLVRNQELLELPNRLLEHLELERLALLGLPQPAAMTGRSLLD